VVRTLEGVPVFLTPFSGVELFSIAVRWSALRYDHRKDRPRWSAPWKAYRFF